MKNKGFGDILNTIIYYYSLLINYLFIIILIIQRLYLNNK